MSSIFANLNFQRIILHNVYKPNDEGRVDPLKSTELTILNGQGLAKLEERVSSVMGNGSHCIEMEIVQSDQVSCYRCASSLLDHDYDQFIAESGQIAELHTNAHTNKNWPGGTLVIIQATTGANNKRCLFIIKQKGKQVLWRMSLITGLSLSI